MKISIKSLGEKLEKCILMKFQQHVVVSEPGIPRGTKHEAQHLTAQNCG